MRYDISLVLKHYGAHVHSNIRTYQGIRCPFHDDTHPSASLDLFRQRFHCFACGFSGDAIAVIRWQEGCSFADAKRKAEEITGESGGEVSGEFGASEWVSGNPGVHTRGGGDVEAWRLL